MQKSKISMFSSPFSGAFMAILLLFSCKLFADTEKVFGLRADGSLDKENISSAYFDGEFDKVRDALETFRKNTPNPNKEDRIFTYKYLSVVYAVDSSTKDRAESYMYQLLKLAPTIELMDMYISDNIQSIFSKVKSDYEKRQDYNNTHDRFGNPLPKNSGENGPAMASVSDQSKSSSKNEKSSLHEKKRKSWLYWTLGGLTVGGVVGGYALLAHYSEEESSPAPIKKHNWEVLIEDQAAR